MSSRALGSASAAATSAEDSAEASSAESAEYLDRHHIVVALLEVEFRCRVQQVQPPVVLLANSGEPADSSAAESDAA